MTQAHVLFLADTTHHTGAVQDHIRAVTSSDKLHWHILNPLVCKTIDKLDLTLFDAVGIHYSIKPYTHYYLSAGLKKKIAAYSGTKFLFLQDEYQNVNGVQEYLHSLQFDLLFSLVNQSIIAKAYPDPRLKDLKKITVLTGYVQDEMKHYQSPAIGERQIDVSYRGRRCEYWLGSLAYEKQWIAEQFTKRVSKGEWRLDISLEESDRVYGDAWINLLKNSKAVLGTESGASVWDFDGSVIKKTNHFMRKNKQAGFPEVYEHVLKPDDGKILYNAISPRVFEAAATKTAMIMFPGYYSGVCEPDTHYIVLEKDFSNLDNVLERLRDTEFLQAMVDRTFDDLILSEKYSQHVFSNLIADQLLLQIGQQRKGQEKAIQQEFQTLEKYQWLNVVRRGATELKFILAQFFKMLLDDKYTVATRFTMLLKGAHRYITYLKSRLAKI